jgi:pimeloyl-ACP methyl ester carboxylesterase
LAGDALLALVRVSVVRMGGFVFTMLAIAATAYLALCAVLFVFQRSLIYFPQPGSLGSANAVVLPTPQARVLVSVRPHHGPDAVIYLGGNAEDVSLSLPGLSIAFPGHAIYLLHYRGYGGSSGKPSEDALFADGLALFDKARAEHPNIVIVGRSLGAGVAVHVASLRPAARLVLVTPFDSLQELAARQFPYLPISWLLQDKFESWRYAPQVRAPTLILAAEHDEIIPRASTELLHSRFASGLASLRIVAGTGHNTVSDSPEYIPLLRGSAE